MTDEGNSRRQWRRMIEVGTVSGIVGVVGGALYGPEMALPLSIFAVASIYISMTVQEIVLNRWGRPTNQD